MRYYGFLALACCAIPSCSTNSGSARTASAMNSDMKDSSGSSGSGHGSATPFDTHSGGAIYNYADDPSGFEHEPGIRISIRPNNN